MSSRGLLPRIRELKHGASPAMRSLAEDVARDPRAASTCSIRALADASHTSPSTVVRFCRKLGCAGYKEFQRELVFELASTSDVNDVALEDIVPGDEAERVLRKVMLSNTRSMEATARLIDLHALEECVRLIDRCRVVDLYGVGASLLVARDLEQKLARVDKECHVYEDLHSQLLSVRNIHADDLAIVFSYSGLTREMLDIARKARRRGATVVAVTRAMGGQLAEEADLVLGVASSEPLVRSGAMSSRLSQLLVVDALYALYVTRNYERCTATMLRNFDEKKPEGATSA